MRFSMLLAAVPALCLAGAALAGDGAPGRGHRLGGDLAGLSPTAAAVPPAHPGQSFDATAATDAACPQGACPEEVALGR